MPPFERWDVVAVPFPYVERPIQQRRPALVVAAGLGDPHDLPSLVRAAKIATIE
jgi:hypothetical protein